MTAPRFPGATRVLARYDAGVYRWPNDRGLSVAAHRNFDAASGVIETAWDAVPVHFHGPSATDFTVDRGSDGRMDLRIGLDDDQLADLAKDIGGVAS